MKKSININNLSAEQIQDLRKQLKELDKTSDAAKKFLQLIEGAERTFDLSKSHSYFWKKNGNIVMEYNSKNNILWVHYYNIWSVLETEFGLNYEEIKELIKVQVEEAWNLKDVTPTHFLDFPIVRWKRLGI